MKQTDFLVLATAAAVLSFSARSRADDDSDTHHTERRSGPRFGTAGHVVFDEMIGLQASGAPVGSSGGMVGVVGIVSYASTSSRDATGTVTQLALQPSADVFVVDRWSVGGTVAVSYVKDRAVDPIFGGPGEELRTTALTFRPRIGYVISLGDDLALWPRINVGHTTAWTEGYGVSTTGRTWSAGGELGLIVQLGRYALLDVGPQVSYETRNTDSFAPTPQGSVIALGGRGRIGLVF
jgi:hypothetical protein